MGAKNKNVKKARIHVEYYNSHVNELHTAGWMDVFVAEVIGIMERHDGRRRRFRIRAAGYGFRL